MTQWDSVNDDRCSSIRDGAGRGRYVAPNGLDPNLMTAPERLQEIGEILAAGLLRLRARESAILTGTATIDPGLAHSHSRAAGAHEPTRRCRAQRSAGRTR